MTITDPFSRKFAPRKSSRRVGWTHRSNCGTFCDIAVAIWRSISNWPFFVGHKVSSKVGWDLQHFLGMKSTALESRRCFLLEESMSGRWRVVMFQYTGFSICSLTGREVENVPCEGCLCSFGWNAQWGVAALLAKMEALCLSFGLDFKRKKIVQNPISQGPQFESDFKTPFQDTSETGQLSRALVNGSYRNAIEIAILETKLRFSDFLLILVC